MTQDEKAADQVLCHHHWEDGACTQCGLTYVSYAGGTVRAALTMQGMWDEEDEAYFKALVEGTDEYPGADRD